MTAGEVLIERSGPGGIQLLNGLYDAKLDHQPVLAITGLQFHVEPPLPAKITADQALYFAESLARGEPKSRKDRADGRVGKSKGDDLSCGGPRLSGAGEGGCPNNQ